MKKIEIVSPAGNLASLRVAVDNGADVVYASFNDATNARNFEGLNFTYETLVRGIEYAHIKGKKVYIAINTFPQMDSYPQWFSAVDKAVDADVDAVIIGNIGIMKYARETYPDINIHLSVQASASNYESINFYKREFGIKRVVLPRVLTIDEMKMIKERTDVEIEVFVLGGLCINIEGRCYLSSFITGSSTNTDGACSPSRFVRFINEGERMKITLNDTVLNDLGPAETSPYPTSCKGRYVRPDGRKEYIMEEPESLNVIELIPRLIDAGVDALKIEGRQRTKAYVGTVTSVVREVVDSYYRNPQDFVMKQEWLDRTNANFEGGKLTFGCYLEK